MEWNPRLGGRCRGVERRREVRRSRRAAWWDPFWCLEVVGTK